MGKRHNISGVYIFDKLKGDKKAEPTCIEDCTEETRLKWLESLNGEQLKNCANHLADALRRLAEFGRKDGFIDADGETAMLHDAAEWERYASVREVDGCCHVLRNLCVYLGIYAK